MDKNNKKIIVWNVTNKCNLNCEFCFGPEKGLEDFNKQEGFAKIDQFKRQGAEKLVFTGGEPLTRKDLVDLIRYAKEKGLYTILHTNGLLLTLDKLKELSKYLDQINLPIDSSADSTRIAGQAGVDRTLIREPGVFTKVMEILAWLKGYSKLRIVISTVVTKMNKDCIIKISKILPEYIYKWRIFQFKPVGKAMMFKKKYEIGDKEFEKISEDVKKLSLNFEVQFVDKDGDFYEGYIEI